MTRPLGVVAAVAVAAVAAGCAPGWKSTPHETVYQRAPPPALHPKPPTRLEPTDWWDEALHSVVVPLGNTISPGHWVERAAGSPAALDVNAFGQVPDSTWFENRINRGRISTETIAGGPDPGRAPAPGPLTVISGKLQGVTPGFIIRDSRGVIWFVKLDPPAYPNVATGAEMIGTRLLWAAGYHVPENYLIDLELSRLRLAEGAETRDDYNRTVPLTPAGLRVLLLQLNPRADGQLRALFSRAVPGDAVGPFHFRGTRAGDPNDRIPHQRRRSLRGLAVFYAWVNNTDARFQNTMDTFVRAAPESDRGYLVHYLIDFGDSIGSSGDRGKTTSEGYELRLDWHEIGLRLVTFGFRDPLWFRVNRSPFREVGVFEAEVFDPGEWSPTYNNPAFLAADADDRLWAASILAHFTAEDIEAAVSAARYRDPAASAWVARVLMQRRVKLLRHAFAGRCPLDAPRTRGALLELTDLVVLAELTDAPATYRWQVKWNRTRARDRHLGSAETAIPSLDLAPVIAEARRRWGAGFEDDPFLTATVQRVTAGERGPPLEVHLRVTGQRVFPVGLARH